MPVAEGVSQCGDCLLHPPALDACGAALDYRYPWAELIAQFKFAPCDPGWAAHLWQLLRRAPQAKQFIHEADLVLPIPLSRERLAERGFNQALLLARRLGATEKICTDLLLRVLHTPAQSQLTRAQRLRNLRASFAVDPLKAVEIKGRRVLLVDDVMTAGTAVREVIPKLKAEADVEVVGLVLSVDRMEKTKDSDTSAVKAVEAEFGFPVFAIANVREIFEAGQHIETADGTAYVTDEIKAAADAYLEQYGA